MPGVELDRCMVRNRLYGAMPGFHVRPGDASDTGTYIGNIEALPFPPASLDAVVMHHALDCCADPRTAMREVCKVLRPGGRLLICGFNPISLWGVRRLAARLFDDAFSDVRFVNPWRLLDWMAVLGIEADEGVQYTMYRPSGRYRIVRAQIVGAPARCARGSACAAWRRLLRAGSQERGGYDAPARYRVAAPCKHHLGGRSASDATQSAVTSPLARDLH